jgi:DNA-binding NarL/FixJ family response regulator
LPREADLGGSHARSGQAHNQQFHAGVKDASDGAFVTIFQSLRSTVESIHGTPLLSYIVSVSERSLLVIDSDPAVHELLAGALNREDRKIQNVYDGREALSYLRANPCDLVLAGQGGNGSDGMRLVRKIRGIQPEVRIIVTGEQSAERAIDAMRARAYSYFHKPLAAGALAEMVHQALESSAWQNDIKILSARREWISMEVRCKLEAAERAVHLIGELIGEMPQEIWEDVATAFRELLLNAIEHGGKSDARKRVLVKLLRTARSLIVHVQDPGKGFSLESLHHSALCNPEDSPTRHVEIRAETGQRPGGFGILMARNLVDELLYNERGNEVMFVKYLDREK